MTLILLCTYKLCPVIPVPARFPDDPNASSDSVNRYPKPLVVPIYSYPVYSNAGMAILGEAAVVANAAFDNEMGVVESPPT